MERKEIIDMATGIAGGLLLIAAVLLFILWPQDPAPAPSFNVEYDEVLVDLNHSDAADVAEGDRHVFPFQVDSNTVHQLIVEIEWTDDSPSSLPDTFALVVLDPDGNQVSDSIQVANQPPATDGGVVANYQALTQHVDLTATLRDPPRSGIVVVDEGMTMEQMQTDVSADLVTIPAGQWSLEVRLIEAGDCPTASSDPTRSIDCQIQDQDGDNQNPIQVVGIRYMSYTATVTDPQDAPADTDEEGDA